MGDRCLPGGRSAALSLCLPRASILEAAWPVWGLREPRVLGGLGPLCDRSFRCLAVAVSGRDPAVTRRRPVTPECLWAHSMEGAR